MPNEKNILKAYISGTAPKLKTVHVAQNPLITPSKDIVALGSTAILEFLRLEWNKAHPERRIEFKEC